MEPIHILFVEDDLTAAGLIVDFLQEYGFVVEYTDTITSALSFLQQYSFDLVLLDLRLPDFSGFELLKSTQTRDIPIIVISALSDTATKVQAFRYGAIDYLVKPVDLQELEARIWAHLRRRGKVEQEPENPLFKIRENRLYQNGKAVDLTPTEFALFEMLLLNRHNILPREELMNALSSQSALRTLDYHIRNIREKIEPEPKNPKYLKTEYGVGYKLTF